MGVLKPLREVACQFLGTPPSCATLRNYIKRGVLSVGGDRIRLKATKVGASYLVLEEDFAAFLKALREGEVTSRVGRPASARVGKSER